MTISPYQVDSVINAYNKQSRLRVRQESKIDDTSKEPYTDVVEISQKGIDKAEVYKKISYSLVDVIVKNKI